MKFKFTDNDFSLCTGHKREAAKLRDRFLELYNDLIPLLQEDPTLCNFVASRERNYNRLHTSSPYVPNFQIRGNGYREHFWVGFAWNKLEWKDPRVGVQFEFGIDEDGSRFYGIWVEGTGEVRSTERRIYEVLAKENPKLILSTLSDLGPEYYLWINRDEDNRDIIDSKATKITVNGISSFVENLRNKALWIHLGKKLTRKGLCSIEDIPYDITKTVRHLLPVYLWLCGLSGRPMAEDEAYKILKSRNTSLRNRVFSNQVGEREAYVSLRVGQNAIRQYILEQYGNKCALCDISDPSLLIASHIVPWSEDRKNRGNPRNVICMCALHDKLFENGLLRIDGNYQVTFSENFHRCCKNSVTLNSLAANTNESLRLPLNNKPDPELLKKRIRQR